MSLRPGDTVEHFTIVSPLGAGGMGRVYLARDTRLQRQVALKIVQPDPGDGSGSGARSSGAARLIREAQSAAALEHPNVVTIYEVGEIASEGEAAGAPFIAMELVKGKALRAFVGDPSVPIEQRVRWLTDVARALAAAHAVGLVHRDVKPENVMIRDDGVVKVLDFGLAKRAAAPASLSSSTEAQVLPSLTAKGVAIGTPYYMAPEQMRREPLDGRADQFAWGVVAYELLAGVLPWGRETDALELVSKILSDEPTPIAQVAPDVPALVAEAVSRAMAKKRTDRYASMTELIAQLEGTSAGLAEISHPATTPPVGPDGPKRAGSRFGLIAIGGAALAAVLGAVAATRAPRVPTSGRPVAPSSSLAQCARSSECVAKSGGKAAICARGTCRTIDTEDCKATFAPGDLTRDDTVWLGAMYPLTGPDASFGVPEARAVELARDDLASLRKAVEGARAVRPLALVTCDDAAAPDRVAHHLVDDLEVPAIIGFRSSTELMDLAGSLFLPHRVLAVAALNTSPLVTQVPSPPDAPRLVWRTTYSLAATGAPLARLIERDLGPRVARARGGPIRLALLRTKTTGAIAFAHALLSELTLNGARAITAERDVVREIVVEPSDTASPESAKDAAHQLEAFAPDLVVFQLPEDLVRDVIEPAEAAWHAHQVAPPTYATMSVLGPELLAWAGSTPERRRRFFGLSTRSDTVAQAHFVMHYNESSAQKVSRSLSPSESYDAFYVLAYASYAATEGSIGGPALARGIAHLVPPGKPIEVGPTQALEAIETLQRGGNIDLEGATGKLDFDLTRGEAPVDFAVLCVAPGAKDRGAENVESGATYDATTKELRGALACP